MPLRRVLAVGGGAIGEDGAGGRSAAVLVVTRGTVPERLKVMDIQTDGTDATEKIIEFVRAYGRGIDALMAKSVPIAGFNFIDAGRVLAECRVPSVFVLGEEPDMVAVRSALREHFADWECRLRAIEAAGPVHSLEEGGERVFIECVGIGLRDALALVKGLTIFGRFPEPVRLAGMAARAVSDLAAPGQV